MLQKMFVSMAIATLVISVYQAYFKNNNILGVKLAMAAVTIVVIGIFI